MIKVDDEVKNDKEFDSDDFSEIVLKHLVRDKEVFKLALKCKMLPDDFLNSTKGGIRLYQGMAKVVFAIEESPVSRDLFTLSIDSQLDEGLKEGFKDQIPDFLDAIYDGELNIEYVKKHLLRFIKRRRYKKAVLDKSNNPEALLDELNKIHGNIRSVEVEQKARTIKPFATLVKQKTRQGVKMGIDLIDKKTGGLGAGECSLMLGMSGTGKTAVSSYIARNAAIGGKNVLYLSAEEPAESIVCRWYAQQFNMDYSALYRGDLEFEKEQRFRELPPTKRAVLEERLEIMDVRELTPISANDIRDILDKKALEEGFYPDIVIIDQMDYMRTNATFANKQAGKWELYEKIAFECDQLSHHKIAGYHEFALRVLHQGKGASLWYFDYDSISGFKGVVKPFDEVIGIGKEDGEDHHIHLFAMKVRHCDKFKLPMAADFSTMTFTPDPTYKTKEERDKLEKKKKRVKAIPATNPTADA